MTLGGSEQNCLRRDEQWRIQELLVEGAELRKLDESPPQAEKFFEVADCCM